MGVLQGGQCRVSTTMATALESARQSPEALLQMHLLLTPLPDLNAAAAGTDMQIFMQPLALQFWHVFIRELRRNCRRWRSWVVFIFFNQMLLFTAFTMLASNPDENYVYTVLKRLLRLHIWPNSTPFMLTNFILQSRFQRLLQIQREVVDGQYRLWTWVFADLFVLNVVGIFCCACTAWQVSSTEDDTTVLTVASFGGMQLFSWFNAFTMFLVLLSGELINGQRLPVITSSVLIAGGISSGIGLPLKCLIPAVRALAVWNPIACYNEVVFFEAYGEFPGSPPSLFNPYLPVKTCRFRLAAWTITLNLLCIIVAEVRSAHLRRRFTFRCPTRSVRTAQENSSGSGVAGEIQKLL